jgi:hypothetical protein
MNLRGWQFDCISLSEIQGVHMTYFKNNGIVVLSVMLVIGLLPAAGRADDSANIARVKSLVQNDKAKLSNDAARMKQDDANYESAKNWKSITGAAALVGATCAVVTAAWEMTHSTYKTSEGFTFQHDPVLSALPAIGCSSVALPAAAQYFSASGSMSNHPAVVQADMKALHNDVLTLDQDQKLLNKVEGAKISAAAH